MWAILISYGNIPTGPTPLTSLIQKALRPFHPGRAARKLGKKKLEISAKMKISFQGGRKWGSCMNMGGLYDSLGTQTGVVPFPSTLTSCGGKLGFSPILDQWDQLSSAPNSSRKESCTLRLEGTLEGHSGQWDGGGSWGEWQLTKEVLFLRGKATICLPGPKGPPVLWRED